MSSTNLHELIDKDDPKCLYCNSECDLNLSSQWIHSTASKADVEKLSCRKCREEFLIHSIQGGDGATHYNGFTFTCKDYKVFFNYIESYFDMSNIKSGEYIIAIPSFEVEFSNKEKLYQKLKTYIVFS